MKQISFNEVVLFLEAWFFLALSRIILLFVPFKRIIKLFGNKVNHDEIILSEDISVQKNIQLSIYRGCRYSFWRTMCFEQALAARMMLKRRAIPSRIYFGVKKSEDNSKQMKAHAWLDSEGLTLTGKEGKESFTIVGSFE